MSSVVISGDTSGAITLAAPSVAGTNTATLPASTGTVMVSGNQPAFRVTASTGASQTSSTFTKVIFDTKTSGDNSAFDTNSNFNTSNYRFTPTIAGYYQINAAVAYVATGTTRFITSIYKNGSSYARGNDIYATGQQAVVSDIVYCNGSTDYIEIYGFITYVSSATVTGIYFSGCLVRNA